MTDRLAELGALQYAVENLSTAGTNPNRLGLAGYIHAAYTDYQAWAAANPGVNPNRLSARGRLYGYFYDHASWSPLSLFASGEQGAWYDPSDMTTMFQKSNGSNPVTADGQAVGLILDKRLGLTPTPVSTNTLESGWDTSDPRWTFSSTSVSWVGGGGEVSQPAKVYLLSDYRNKYVKVTYTITGYSGTGACGIDGGVLSILPGGAYSDGAEATANGNGTYSFYGYWRGAGATGTYISLLGRGTNSFTISNITVVEALGNHASQATAASIPLKTSTGISKWINYDAVDDVLNTTFTSSLGSSCTVCRSNVGAAPTILTGQTIGTSYADSTDNAGLIIINRALTGQETTDVTAWLTAKGAT